MVGYYLEGNRFRTYLKNNQYKTDLKLIKRIIVSKNNHFKPIWRVGYLELIGKKRSETNLQLEKKNFIVKIIYEQKFYEKYFLFKKM